MALAEEADRGARERQHEQHRREQHAELMTGVDARRERRAVGREGFAEKSHATTTPAPSAPTISTVAPRRRSGTRQSHSASPRISAASAPRE